MLSVTLITYNEETNLYDALTSVSWADEIVVVDAESTDKTQEIAKTFGAKLIIRPWTNYADQKNFADSQASGDWILNLDADERVTEELKNKISIVIKDKSISAFYVRRRNYYLGRWLKYSGWYPDYQLRLYERSSGRWEGQYVHESFYTNKKIAYIKADLLHYSIQNLEDHHERLGRYTGLAALQMKSNGKIVHHWQIMMLPMISFIRSYLFKLGFLDGIPGLCVSFFAAYYVFLKYTKCWQNQSRENINFKEN